MYAGSTRAILFKEKMSEKTHVYIDCSGSMEQHLKDPLLVAIQTRFPNSTVFLFGETLVELQTGESIRDGLARGRFKTYELPSLVLENVAKTNPDRVVVITDPDLTSAKSQKSNNGNEGWLIPLRLKRENWQFIILISRPQQNAKYELAESSGLYEIRLQGIDIEAMQRVPPAPQPDEYIFKPWFGGSLPPV
jgi:hypothetical protein